MPDLKKRIEERAYQLYLARGGRHGDAVSDWLRAEKEIMHESKAEPKVTKKPPRKKK
jgi:hypothetical protein